jgi:hypothetical protein
MEHPATPIQIASLTTAATAIAVLQASVVYPIQTVLLAKFAIRLLPHAFNLDQPILRLMLRRRRIQQQLGF